MKKFLCVIVWCLFSSLSVAHDEIVHLTEKPNLALQTIIDNSIKQMQKLHQGNEEVDLNAVNSLIYKHLTPFIDNRFAASEVLSNHWNQLNETEKINLSQYIVDSLINDYSFVLVGYDNFDNINIVADNNFRQKDNKAIVKLNVAINQSNITIIAKMIKTDIWRIYDIVIGGVSLLKTYESNFNSFIKNKGFDEFTKKYLR